MIGTPRAGCAGCADTRYTRGPADDHGKVHVIQVGANFHFGRSLYKAGNSVGGFVPTQP